MQLPGLLRIQDLVSQNASTDGPGAYSKMSLPGLGLSVALESQYHPPVVHELKEGTEWRFEVAFESNVEVKVLHPDAQKLDTVANSFLTATFRRRRVVRFGACPTTDVYICWDKGRDLYMAWLPAGGHR